MTDTPDNVVPFPAGGRHGNPDAPEPEPGPVPEKRKPGRPTKLNDDVVEKVCAAIRMGSYIETAAAYAGITKETLYDWMRKGSTPPPTDGSDDGLDRHRAFSDAVKEALAAGEMRDLAFIDGAARAGTWQAAAWRLERRHPSKWGRREHSEMVVRAGEPDDGKNDAAKSELDALDLAGVVAELDAYRRSMELEAIEGEAVELPAGDDGG